MATATEPTVDRLAPPTPPARRLRVPQLVVGVLLTAGMALAFVVWNAASVQRVPVLALSEDVVRGHVLAHEDLRVVHVGTDDELAATAPEEAGTLVGRVAVVDLPRGTLVVDEHLAVGSALTPGAGVVGLALSPGQYPTAQLRVGDLVNVVVASGEPPQGRLLVQAAEVVWVEPVGTQGHRFVSVLTGEDLAGEVAAVAAAGEVRLVLVARDDPADRQGGS
jgi:hypothetical protein